MGMSWEWDKSTPIIKYRKFGCPGCGAKHKYGHKREYINCWRCWRTFSPELDARRYENELLSNLSHSEQQSAKSDINSVPPWVAKKRKAAQKRKAARQAKEQAKEQARLAARPWWQKVKDFILKR